VVSFSASRVRWMSRRYSLKQTDILLAGAGAELQAGAVKDPGTSGACAERVGPKFDIRKFHDEILDGEHCRLIFWKRDDKWIANRRGGEGLASCPWRLPSTIFILWRPA